MFLIQKKEGENSHIEQVSTVANYKYYKTKKIIQLNEGLVGRCIFEKKHIILTEIPENYIEISSGLGTAKPRNLLIVPLQNDSEILGALEFATFQIFENHVIDFILMVAEDITTTLQNIYINNKTNELLQESRLNAKRNEENDKKYQQIILKSKNKMNEMLEREKQLVEENERLKRQISDFEQKKNKPT
jgi:methyl-accepting chemotaxis protein